MTGDPWDWTETFSPTDRSAPLPYEPTPEETAYMEEHYPAAMTVIGPSFDPDGPGYEMGRPPYGLEAGTIECPICGDVERCRGCDRRCTCECICED